MQLKGTQTEQNLWNAFAGESQTRNKYTYYSQKAEAEGFIEAAKLFRSSAAHEEEHAKALLSFLNGIKDTKANLRDAIQGEIYESHTLYKEYERVALAEGLEDIAVFFKKLSEAEEQHEHAFKGLLKRILEENK
ncbi:rubrerythrin family protein [Alkaliphilus peptidifermentans]|uniref:Rubrerythrin n=1 Tax=Alkaliphilus peptidifermentans DSM 18978 TaxID=1120976 RepID=A0A1G5L3U5_9FIRM|nr:rubrerythrin family protein [Alkaliphilus peptidifermentans]SCZ06859.1 Rubrerythrin [Alkaliphilus peptidifermentans DSM 18978]